MGFFLEERYYILYTSLNSGSEPATDAAGEWFLADFQGRDVVL